METKSRVGGISLEGKRVTRPAQADQTEEDSNCLESSVINNKKINILYTNADCFSNKRDDLSLLLGTLNFRPGIIVVQRLILSFCVTVCVKMISL